MKLIKAEVFNLYSYLYLPVSDLISSGCLHPLLAASRTGRGMRDGPMTKKTALLLLLDQPSPARPWPATRQRKKRTSVTKLKGMMLLRSWSPSDPQRLGRVLWCPTASGNLCSIYRTTGPGSARACSGRMLSPAAPRLAPSSLWALNDAKGLVRIFLLWRLSRKQLMQPLLLIPSAHIQWIRKLQAPSSLIPIYVLSHLHSTFCH